MFDDKTPEVTPMPATMSPTSPLEIIPMPTFIAFDLFLKNRNAGKPLPPNLLIIAMTIMIADRNRTSKLTPVRFTCAPIIAKNNGQILSLICQRILQLV
jgi:hypothetical protein